MARTVTTPVCPRVLVALVTLAATAALLGCGKDGAQVPTANLKGSGEASAASPAAAAATDAKAPSADPAKLLAEMVAKYHQAKSYGDAGELYVEIDSGQGQPQKLPAHPFSVAFERPNKARIHSLSASIVADGEKLYASVHGLRGQVLVTPDPAQLTIESLEADKLLVQAMRGQLDVQLPQLQLLMLDDPIQAIAGNGTPKLLPDEDFDGQDCHRVAVDDSEGTNVFWISKDSGLLVRLDRPPVRFGDPQTGPTAAIRFDFRGAHLDGEISADAFTFHVPEDAKLLSRLLPPPPEPPSPLLGKKPGEFQFIDESGEVVNQETLAGRVVVLDMWATWCGWCFEGFPNLQKVYDQFQGDNKLAILAVNTDDVAVTDEQVRKSFEEAKIHLPIVRDTKRIADSVFQVQGLPTMVILGADGTIEDYHIGYDPNLAKTLPGKLERLLLGESLAAEEIEKYEKAVEEYRKAEADALAADADVGPIVE